MTSKSTDTDFLSVFDDSQNTQTPATPPQGQSPNINTNDPNVVAAMSHARSQERDRYYADLEKEKSRAREAQDKLKQLQDQVQAEQAAREEERIKALKGDEKWEARLKQLQDQLQERDHKLNHTVTEANTRIEAWQVAAEREKIVNQYQGRIDTNALDTSSVQALHASVPRALQSYEQLRNRFYSEFQNDMQGNKQAFVEGLAPGPINNGFPSLNNAQAPAPAAAGNGVPNFEHPMVDNGQSYNQMREALHGRVMTASPPSAGQTMFNPQYPTPPHMQHQQMLQQQPVQGQQSLPPNPMYDASAGADPASAVQRAQDVIAKFRNNPGGQATSVDSSTGMNVFGGQQAPTNHPAATQPVPSQSQPHPMIRNN